MNRYIIGDLHIGHKNISKFREAYKLQDPSAKWRPSADQSASSIPHNNYVPLSSKEHWERAFEGIERLSKRSMVFLLGDIIFRKEHLERMSKVRCRKILIGGNHCLGEGRGITMKDLVDVYDDILFLHKYKGHWLSHAPIHPEELRGKRCVHGHCHPYLMLDKEGYPDPNYISVSVEYTSYTPITWEYATSEEYRQECRKKWDYYRASGKIE